MPWKALLLVIALLLAAFVVLVISNLGRLDQVNRGLAQDLLAQRTVVTPLDAAALEALPEPVATYLGRALPGGSWPASVRFEQEGEMLQGGAWRKFNAVQHVTAQPPGFVWDARIAFAPAVEARVIDMYSHGEGVLRATLLGTFTVANAPRGPELNESELIRYLAEGPWLPTVLAPRPGLEWSAVDESSARAVLEHAGNSASLLFHFDDEGDISRIEGERPRGLEGGAADVGIWVGRFWNYQSIGGVRIPLEGEVGWMGEEGVEPYWRGMVQEAEFDPPAE